MLCCDRQTDGRTVPRVRRQTRPVYSCLASDRSSNFASTSVLSSSSHQHLNTTGTQPPRCLCTREQIASVVSTAHHSKAGSHTNDGYPQPSISVALFSSTNWVQCYVAVIVFISFFPTFYAFVSDCRRLHSVVRLIHECVTLNTISYKLFVRILS